LTNRKEAPKIKSTELSVRAALRGKPAKWERVKMQAQVTGTPQRKLAPITTRTFGRFRLERRIAYGGMAEILLATELRSGRPMALKRILPQYSSNPEFVQYFIHEGRLGQRLTHPNLVETFEAGQVGETCYIALEYLRGATCIELLRAATKAGVDLPLGVAVRVVADAARGLHYAHSATDATGNPLGVVHRDVTPHNLFLCRDGLTKVLDFGIAKAASQLHHTRTGTIKGKFSYLAPEQIRGETIDKRVDVFALGIVLHELLTLKPLFRGVNDADTLQRILTLEVAPPERVRHTVPPGLGAVALRALQRDRDRRLPSAEALADSIEAVAEAECIDASPEVVASLLAELCPATPDESAVGRPDAALDFALDPPSVRSASRSKRVPAAGALGATGSGLSNPQASPPPLPLPPPPMAAEMSPLTIDSGEIRLIDEAQDAEQARSPSALVATPMVDMPSAPLAVPELALQLADTAPNRPPSLPTPTSPPTSPPTSEDRPPIDSFVDEVEIEVTPSSPPVAVGRDSGAAASMDLTGQRARGRAGRLAVLVGAAVVAVSLVLLRTNCHPLGVSQVALPQAPPATMPTAQAPSTAEAPAARPLPAPRLMEPAPRVPEPARMVAPPRAAEGTLRVQAEGALSYTVDGRPVHASADGALHLPPGRHKVIVQSPALGAPRSLDVELKDGDELVRALHAGRGRLRLAVTPWAEVLVDGHPAGTTPFAPLDLGEGTHVVTLRNGDLGANQRKKVLVQPDKETVLRVDLFSR
jgi:eukaryotic-like serine/threonine-protein kinase